MTHTFRSKLLSAVTLSTGLVLAALAPQAQAALKCEELVAKKTCTDSGPRQVTLATGQTVSLAAPIIPGYATACWNWSRKFQCVETNPVYACDSGNSLDSVKKDCSLISSKVVSTTTINSVRYITAADYAYRCEFGDWSTSDKLPSGKECVFIKDTTTATNYVNSAPPASSLTAPLNTSLALTENRDDKYACYSPAVTTCVDKCYQEVYNATTKVYDKQEVACPASSVTNCVSSSKQCTGTVTSTGGNLSDALAAQPSVGPDGRCVNAEEEFTCQAGEVPKCLNSANCTLSSTTAAGVQTNGFATLQEQTYICTDEKTSCLESANVSNCVHVGAWGWDQMAIKSQMGQGLAEANSAMAKIEGIQKGMNKEDLYIFSGNAMACSYPVGNFLNTFITIAVIGATLIATGGASAGLLSTALQSTTVMGSAAMTAATANTVAAAVTIGAAAAQEIPNSKAFGTNCCKDFVFEGSDAWYKLGSCTAEEIKLSVAKRKGLVKYLGEYCSKKSGFPVRQCVKKTRSYCVFDDMLALTINEQGRAQLDALASADTVSTQNTPDKSFPFYGTPVASPAQYSGVLNTGKWVKLEQANHSQVWAWQYPNYCKSSADQQAAYAIWQAELAKAMDTKGAVPETLTDKQAIELLAKSLSVAVFQDCPSTPGTLSFMTCADSSDNCNTAKMPTDPSSVDIDVTGALLESPDPNWRIQQTRSFSMPGDYGVTALMPNNSGYAALSASLNEYVTAVGSCHSSDGTCLYYFSITDKQASGGAGARKRMTEKAQFPLYTGVQTSAWPAVTYVNADGTYDAAAYAADPNRGLGDAVLVSNQRFIFHPVYTGTPPKGNLHSKLLLEYANQTVPGSNPQNDYQPLMLPTSLPPGTPGWSPYGDSATKGKYFYISGGCDANSRWCNYDIQVDLDIQRHPWGSAQSPRCWGFSLEQLAALDFDKMDLSRWINSMDLGTSPDLAPTAAKAMTDRVTNTAQAFYSAMSNSTPINKPGGGTVALVTNTDVVPRPGFGGDFEAYRVEAAVPTNWPNYFPDGNNNNPVTNPTIDWGDGSAAESMIRHAEGRAYTAQHDYGDRPVGRYKITVTLNTDANGPQTLATYISVTPDSGKAKPEQVLDFNNPGAVGQAQGTYNPADTLNGLNQSPENLKSLSPGTSDQFKGQGATIHKPAS